MRSLPKGLGCGTWSPWATALVRPLEAGHGLVETVLARRSGSVRPDPLYSHLKQIIAANVDQLLIVASWREPHLWLLMIDEYLIAAARNHFAGGDLH